MGKWPKKNSYLLGKEPSIGTFGIIEKKMENRVKAFVLLQVLLHDEAKIYLDLSIANEDYLVRVIDTINGS